MQGWRFGFDLVAPMFFETSLSEMWCFMLQTALQLKFIRLAWGSGTLRAGAGAGFPVSSSRPRCSTMGTVQLGVVSVDTAPGEL